MDISGEYEYNGRVWRIHQLNVPEIKDVGFCGFYKDVLNRKWTSGLIRMSKQDAKELGSSQVLSLVLEIADQRLCDGRAYKDTTMN